jgi:hypothetical protein
MPGKNGSSLRPSETELLEWRFTTITPGAKYFEVYKNKEIYFTRQSLF